MNNDPRGTIIQQGNIMRIDNALVEDVFTFHRSSTGYILISYAVSEPNRRTSIQNLKLNISQTTLLLNTFGQRIRLSDIRQGMWINVVFSALMTRSIPPQTNAYLVIVQRPSENPVETTTTRIASIDPSGEFLYTGNPDDPNRQIRFAIENASILNRSGRPVDVRALRPGQRVRITHANFMTASIPPQTTAFQIQIL